MLRYLISFIFVMALSANAFAQDKPQTKTQTPSKETKADKPKKIDMDTFFKESEDRVKSGDHCGPKMNKEPEVKPDKKTPIA